MKMTDILSQDEINRLLAAISSGDDQSAKATKEYAIDRIKVKIHDFKRPNKLSWRLTRQLQMVHEIMARSLTTAISSRLRILATVHVNEIDQITFEEFLRSIPNPTCLVFLRDAALPGPCVMEVDPSISFSMIDRLCGGMAENSKLTREATEFELALLEDVVKEWLPAVGEAWSVIGTFSPRFDGFETNPQYINTVPPNEMVILATFEFKLGEGAGEIEGMINMCYPYIVVEPLLHEFSRSYVANAANEPNENSKQSSELKRDVQIEILHEFEAAQPQLTYKQLCSLKSKMRLNVEDSTRVQSQYRTIMRKNRLGKNHG
jgi:flagellar motor switch protein FliM